MRRTRIFLGGTCLVLLSACSAGTGSQVGSAADAPAGPSAQILKSSGAALPSTPQGLGYGREPHLFDTLPEMVDTADLVVSGEVVGVTPGRKVNEFQYRVYEFAVERIFKGEPVAGSVLVEEVGWLEGAPWTFNHAAWAEPGDRAVVALIRKPEGEQFEGRPVYQLASTQSRFFLTPDGGVEDNYLTDAATDPFTAAQEKKTHKALLGDVEAAASPE